MQGWMGAGWVVALRAVVMVLRVGVRWVEFLAGTVAAAASVAVGKLVWVCTKSTALDCVDDTKVTLALEIAPRPLGPRAHTHRAFPFS